MGLVDNVKKIMEAARENGQSYMRMDRLAYELMAIGQVGLEPTQKQLSGEILQKKLAKWEEMAKDGDVEFPFEIITYRERESRGLDFEGVVYKELPLLDEDGNPKLTKGGKESIQRYYWPVLAWVDEERQRAATYMQTLASKLRQSMSKMGEPASHVHISVNGLLITLEYVMPVSVKPEPEADDEDNLLSA